MKKRRQSIRFKIILWTVGFSTIFALAAAVASFLVSQAYLRQSQRYSARTMVQLLGSEIGADINTITLFANWVCIDSSISNYLNELYRAGLYGSSREEGEVKYLRQMSLTTWNHFNNEYNTIGVRNLLGRAVISDITGTTYMQAITTNYYSPSGQIPQLIMKAPFYESLIHEKPYKWLGIADNPLSTYHNTRVIPLLRPIRHTSTSRTLGWIYLEIPQDFILRRLGSVTLAPDSYLYITIGGDHTYRYEGSSLVEDTLPANAVTYTFPDMDWSVSVLPSEAELSSRSRSYFFIILLVFAMTLSAGALLTQSLRKLITRPVMAILTQLNQIGGGDFTRDPSIEWNNELGDIGKGINALSANVSALMEKKLQDEKVKQELEYRILQSQINPHFMYNTLNTIKWMASIQGADGISQMSTALSRLLKNVSKGTDNLIPLLEELALLDDYFTIMKYRYGGTIELEYDLDESLLSCKIHRFSLQPIVENAIFHGIEPKEAAGLITVSCCREGQDLIISVTDNGVGMDQETIDRIFSGQIQNDNDFFKQVGVANVAQRIKYAFGDQYGIHIDSVPGQYTTMRFNLPLIQDE